MTALQSSAAPSRSLTSKVAIWIDLSEDAIDVMLDRLAQASNTGASITFDHYMHGTVCRIPAEATAFELRRAGSAHVRVLALWNDPSLTAAMVEWCEETWKINFITVIGKSIAHYRIKEKLACISHNLL